MQDNEELFKLYQTKLNELLKVNNREPIIELTLEEWEERHSLIDYVVRQSQKQLKNYEKMFAKKYITENNEVNRIENCAAHSHKTPPTTQLSMTKINISSHNFREKLWKQLLKLWNMVQENMGKALGIGLKLKGI